MTTLTQRTDFESDAKEALTDQFRKDKIQALAGVFAAQIQDIENVCFQLLEGRSLSSAVGVQLDGLGALVGQPREGRSDTTYRIWIAARIRLNLSHGSAEDIYGIFSPLLEAGQSVALTEYYPGAFLLDIYNATTPTAAAQFSSILKLAKPGGVRASLIYSEQNETDTFLFADNTEITSTSQGFSDTSEDGAGGVLAEILE